MTKLPSNLDLLDVSIQYLEPHLDTNYQKEKIVIVPHGDPPNELMKANLRISGLILAWKETRGFGDEGLNKKIVRELDSLLKKTDGINHGEFASFWPTMDMSHSHFKTLEESKRIEFIGLALDRYIKSRLDMYMGYGITATTLQVQADKAAHKRSGSLAHKKIIPILEKQGFKHAVSNLLRDREFILPDSKADQSRYHRLKEDWGLESAYSRGIKKAPDFAFRIGDSLFIVEHKHKQESGGGQNGAIEELLGFIGRNESHSKGAVCYIAYIDGAFFNFVFGTSEVDRDDKGASQRDQIRKTLRDNKCNYLVNTGGFSKLLSEAMSTS